MSEREDKKRVMDTGEIRQGNKDRSDIDGSASCDVVMLCETTWKEGWIEKIYSNDF